MDPEWVFGDEVGMPGAGWMDRAEYQRRLDSPTQIVPTVAPAPPVHYPWTEPAGFFVQEDGSQYTRVRAGEFDDYDRVDSTAVQFRAGLPALTSQNGWPANDRSVIASYTIPGSVRKIALRKGDCSVVLLDILGWIHASVCRIDTGQLDDWGYAERTIRGSSTTLSNHASGTAADLDALRHPLGARGTWTAAQYGAIRARLRFYEGVVRWGADYTGRVDEMHFEINAGSTAVARIANKIRGGAPAPVRNGGPVDRQQQLDAMATGVYHQMSGSPNVGEWPGWPSWQGGSGRTLTPVDYLRQQDVLLNTLLTEVKALRAEVAELKTLLGDG